MNYCEFCFEDTSHKKIHLCHEQIEARRQAEEAEQERQRVVEEEAKRASKAEPEPKPMVTRAQYEQARAVLDALDPGLYMKCSKCRGWYSSNESGLSITFSSDVNEYLCERCS